MGQDIQDKGNHSDALWIFHENNNLDKNKGRVRWTTMDHCSNQRMQVLLYHLLAFWKKLSNKKYLRNFIFLHPS